MNTETLIQSLRDVARVTLEEAAFVFTEELPDSPAFDDDLIETVVTFGGPAHGWLMLCTPKEVADEITASMLGVECDELTDADSTEDAIGELMNIIMGEVADAWFGPQAVLEIGIPVVGKVGASTHADKRRHASFSLALLTDEELPIELTALVEWKR